jgi:hypothetical protein
VLLRIWVKARHKQNKSLSEAVLNFWKLNVELEMKPGACRKMFKPSLKRSVYTLFQKRHMLSQKVGQR